MYLLDTNMCIFAIRRRPENVIRKLYEKSKKGLYLSSLTIAELEYGVENSQNIKGNRISLIKFMSIFNILNFDDADAIPYGKLKATLKKTGQLIGPIDMLLAAQAISKKMVFVTNNTREFERIEGIVLEDWSMV